MSALWSHVPQYRLQWCIGHTHAINTPTTTAASWTLFWGGCVVNYTREKQKHVSRSHVNSQIHKFTSKFRRKSTPTPSQSTMAETEVWNPSPIPVAWVKYCTRSDPPAFDPHFGQTERDWLEGPCIRLSRVRHCGACHCHDHPHPLLHSSIIYWHGYVFTGIWQQSTLSLYISTHLMHLPDAAAAKTCETALGQQRLP